MGHVNVLMEELNNMIKVNIICHTNGRGLWTKQAKECHVNGIRCEGSELIVRFKKNSWDCQADGLIYTDPLWLKEFRINLQKMFGLTIEAVNDIDYSEQGMQGINYVSLDVGSSFLKEWKNIK
jgi:hypothetical protein